MRAGDCHVASQLTLEDVGVTQPRIKTPGPAGPEPSQVGGRERRLIEENSALELLSRKGVEERYQRGKTPHTIFTWWARRPFASVRGVLAAVLADSPEIATSLASSRAHGLSPELKESTHSQRVLDMFAGGGTIPLEAASMGAESYAVDNNELAHFIQLSLLQLSQVDADLPELVMLHGTELLQQLTDETAAFFPLRDGKVAAVAYFWSRSVRCPNCSGELSLQRRPWLSKRNGKRIHIERREDEPNRAFSLTLVRGEETTQTQNAWSGNIIECPFCNHVVDRSRIDEILGNLGFDELTGVCLSNGRGKEFAPAGLEAVPADTWLRKEIESDLSLLDTSMPDLELPRWSGIVNPTLYGVHAAPDLFGQRQLAVLIRYCRLLREKHEQLRSLHGQEIALAVTAFLSALVDQLVDWNSRLCMWIPQNEQVGRALSGPGVPMMWDFVETDPLERGPANLWAKLDRVVAGLRSIPRMNHLPKVVHGDARALPFQDSHFDAVVTDPPYFDNVFYSVLADCIYVWKRLVFVDLLPNIFSEDRTDSERELSASKHRLGSSEAAASFYTTGMTRAFREAKRVLRDDGVFVLFFAHSSIGGWASIIDAFRASGLVLTTSWPLQMERKHRPRGMRSEAVNISFVLTALKGEVESQTDWSDLIRSIGHELPECLERCRGLGLEGGDLGHAVFGSLASNFAKSRFIRSQTETLPTRAALTWLAMQVEGEVPDFKIARR